MIFLSIGSNLPSNNSSREKNIKTTIKMLEENNIKKIKCSSYYETPSYPDKKNPKFINVILQINFSNNTYKLLEKIAIIEKKMGRIRKKTNEPRTCDIDIIDFKQIVIKTKKLTLPHPRLSNRNFVLYPLKEIYSEWKHPISKKNVDILIKNLNINLRNEITKMNESDIFIKE
jgi:2-amino-4-hydroxy-6-hydroxymethyldihydropteridine diphosphokinase